MKCEELNPDARVRIKEGHPSGYGGRTGKIVAIEVTKFDTKRHSPACKMIFATIPLNIRIFATGGIIHFTFLSFFNDLLYLKNANSQTLGKMKTVCRITPPGHCQHTASLLGKALVRIDPSEVLNVCQGQNRPDLRNGRPDIRTKSFNLVRM
ncbi:hypothetical protein C2I18_01585 [Paenibacillus sp. PK3_47]|uniref:hypothetical protein n=1 Tax=Paenibacillus sp. PK3_47 TaxID=2072642 RepID=UPI00201E6EA5|nr:hypothetical protein [Paenibacillus sp. PK3_47]UQZ32354.1 hypothetical protein C2I18_01585 [Paenibacillus sp. PK3_47]